MTQLDNLEEQIDDKKIYTFDELFNRFDLVLFDTNFVAVKNNFLNYLRDQRLYSIPQITQTIRIALQIVSNNLRLLYNNPNLRTIEDVIKESDLGHDLINDQLIHLSRRADSNFKHNHLGEREYAEFKEIKDEFLRCNNKLAKKVRKKRIIPENRKAYEAIEKLVVTVTSQFELKRSKELSSTARKTNEYTYMYKQTMADELLVAQALYRGLVHGNRTVIISNNKDIERIMNFSVNMLNPIGLRVLTKELEERLEFIDVAVVYKKISPGQSPVYHQSFSTVKSVLNRTSLVYHKIMPRTMRTLISHTHHKLNLYDYKD